MKKRTEMNNVINPLQIIFSKAELDNSSLPNFQVSIYRSETEHCVQSLLISKNSLTEQMPACSQLFNLFSN